MRSLALAVLALSLTRALAQQPITAPHALVSSAEPLATDAGVQILQKGGNAFDAAVAVGFALAVTYPQAGNIGGGGFFVGLSQHGTPLMLDFREVAPAAATKTMFLDAAGNVIEGKSTDSWKAVGVPGTVDGLIQLQEKFGKLTLQQDMAPAIALARHGFAVSARMHRSLIANQERFGKKDTGVFYPNGEPLAEGAMFFQPDLADTLQSISDKGRSAFYEGEFAQNFGEAMYRKGGLITANDLHKYHAKWREPFVFSYGDYTFITPPLPSSGGIVLDQILRLVDWQALKTAGHNTAAYVQMLTEAERLAYADRNAYLGDSDFVKVPVRELTSREYLAKRKSLMPVGKAGNSKDIGPGTPEHLQTTHYTAVDRWGNVAAVTYTLNDSYGLGEMLPGAGFLLNNEMDDFTSKPGVANLYGLVQGEFNAIAPFKRPLSSMTPTIVKRKGEFFLTLGSPGGSHIITAVLQTFLNVALFDMNIAEAVDAGRFHHQHLPDYITYEDGALSENVLTELQKMGYTMDKVRALGEVNAIMRMPDGTLAGWADKREAGKTAGY